MTDLLERLRSALHGRYTIQRELGQGGMARVFLADEQHPRRQVALKVLDPDLGIVLGPERFLREVDLAASLTHPHILPIFSAGEADDLLFYTMPYVEGESLRDRLRREKQLPIDNALLIAREVADALSYAHSRGVVHRDIKPENILLEAGHAVVADFGIARAISAAGGDRLTSTGLSVGSPRYMSPEQAAGETDIDGRSDLYSLGCVLYEMLAGDPPFTAPTREAVLRQHLMTQPMSVTNIRPSVPAEVSAALQRALAKTPADRFNPVAQFGEAIGRTAIPVPAARPQPESPPRRSGRKLRRIASFAVVALVAASAAGWALVRTNTANEPAPLEPPDYTIVAEADGSAPADVRDAAQRLVTFRVDQSGILRTVGAGALDQGRQLAGIPDSTPLSVRTARELAFRGGIRTVIAPTLNQFGKSYVLTVQVLNAEDGAVIESEAGTASDPDAIIPLVGTVVDAVRLKLGERRSDIRGTRNIQQVATPSLEAFRHLVAGRRHFRDDSDNSECLRETRLALALDPEFAAAWVLLGFCHNNWGARDSALVAWRRAWDLRDRLDDHARINLEGVLAWTRDGDASKALAVFERGDRLMPGKFNHNRAIILSESFGRFAEAAELHAAARAAAPFGPERLALLNGTRTSMALGRFAEAESLSLLIPVKTRSVIMAMSLRAGQHQWDELGRIADSAYSSPGVVPGVRRIAARGLASSHAARGQLREATRVLSDAAVSGAGSHRLIDRSAWLLHEMYTSAGVRAPAGLRTPGTHVGSALRLGAEGDSAQAFSEWENSRRTGEVVLGEEVAMTSRMITALVDVHRMRDSLVTAALASRMNDWLQIERWWIVAGAYERLGQHDSSAIFLERLTARQGISDEANYLGVGIPYPFALFRLAENYASRGQHDLAEQRYRTFLDTFTRPDPEFAWMVIRARSELERLSRARG